MNIRVLTLGFVIACTPLFAGAAEVIHFGCPAYLIGTTPNLAELKQKGVTSVILDSGSGISAAQAQAQGMVPIYYVNAFCQPDKFRCDGPKMSGSGVSGTYGEVIPHPQSQFFFDNFSAQTQRVQKLGGTIIEIDNMDEYVRRKEVNAIKYLIESAGKSGINVVMKNETNATLVALSNVVGAIVEPGSEGKGYRAAFTAAGKPNAGVLVINGSASDAYTSVSNVNYTGGTGEYTTFYSCNANAGGVKAPTPPTNYQITPPSSLLSQQPTQQLLSNLQRSLMPLAQPVMQPPPPTAAQQTSSSQPLQYFSPSSQASLPNGAASTYATSQPSVAESLLQLLRPTETKPTTVSRGVSVVSTSTSTLYPTRIDTQEYLAGDVTSRPNQTSTFNSSDIQNTPVSEGDTGVFLAILEAVATVLRRVLDFLRGV